jgi:hypothetical protein
MVYEEPLPTSAGTSAQNLCLMISIGYKYAPRTSAGTIMLEVARAIII